MNIQPLSQRDDRWKSRRLGFGTGTIGSYGCLLTAVTVAVNAFGGKYRVDEANEELKSVNGFAGDTKNLLVWSALPKAFKQVKSNGIPETYNNDIAVSMINKGYPVIVEVDGTPIGAPSHWVLLIGNKQMVDPYTGTIEATSKYRIRKMVRWELQQIKEQTELEACLTAHGSCMTALQKAESKIKMLESELFACGVDRNSSQERYVKLEKLHETLKLDLQKTKGEYEKLHGEYEIAKSNASSLEKELLIVNEKLSTALQSPDSAVLQAAHDEISRLEDLLDKQYIKKAKHRWLQIVQEMAYELGTKL